MFASMTGGTLPVRRNRSAKLGPGSSAGENRGRLIGRGGYRLQRATESATLTSDGYSPPFWT